MNRLSLLSISLLTALWGCASTPSDPAPSVASDPLAAARSKCHINARNFTVKVDTGNYSGKQTKLACYGKDDPFCGLRIYQIMVESFNHGEGGAPGYVYAWGPARHNGNLKGIIDKLDYIKSTGVNAIWLTPIFVSEPLPSQDKNADKLDGTGYYTSDYFTIDPKFGTKEEFIKLVELAHEKGLYVFLDGVLGHAKSNIKLKSPGGNELVTSKRCRDAWGQIDKANSTYWCFDTAKSMAFYKELLSYWIKTAKIDGWRFDQMYQLEPAYWKELNKTITETARKTVYKVNGRKVHPLGYSVGEMWSGDTKAITKNAYADENMNSAFNFPLRYQLLKVLATNDDIFAADSCSQPASTLAQAYEDMRFYPSTAMPNNIVSNHDFPRFGDLIQRAGFGKDGVKDDDYFRRHKAAYSFIAAASGPLTMYYNDEIGSELPGFVDQPGNCGDVCRCDDHVGRTDGQFDNLSAGEQDLKNYIAGIYALRDKYPSLAFGERTHVYSDENLYVDLKSYKDEKILYVLNSSTGTGTLSFSQDVTARISGGKMQCDLKNLLSGEVASEGELKISGLSGNFYLLENCR